MIFCEKVCTTQTYSYPIHISFGENMAFNPKMVHIAFHDVRVHINEWAGLNKKISYWPYFKNWLCDLLYFWFENVVSKCLCNHATKVQYLMIYKIIDSHMHNGQGINYDFV